MAGKKLNKILEREKKLHTGSSQKNIPRCFPGISVTVKKNYVKYVHTWRVRGFDNG